MAGKSPLCEDVDTTVHEVGIKMLVGLPVFHVKTVDEAQRSVIDGLVQ